MNPNAPAIRRPLPWTLTDRNLCCALLVVLATLALLIMVRPAFAEVVSGRITNFGPPSSARVPSGYVRTLVTAPAEAVNPAVPPLTVFLRVEESLPLEPATPITLGLSGLAFQPELAACAVDGSVVLRNDDVQAVTFVIEGVPVGAVEPGGSLTYECTAGATGEELREVSTVEWPWVRGGIYVGEVGAPGVVEADGRFRVVASRGTYLLRVIGPSGIVLQQSLEVADRAVNVGAIDLSKDADR